MAGLWRWSLRHIWIIMYQRYCGYKRRREQRDKKKRGSLGSLNGFERHSGAICGSNNRFKLFSILKIPLPSPPPQKKKRKHTKIPLYNATRVFCFCFSEKEKERMRERKKERKSEKNARGLAGSESPPRFSTILSGNGCRRVNPRKSRCRRTGLGNAARISFLCLEFAIPKVEI